MYGKSWGGFNGLQVAFEQPPALKAFISLFSTGKIISVWVKTSTSHGDIKRNDVLPYSGIFITLKGSENYCYKSRFLQKRCSLRQGNLPSNAITV